MRIRIQKGFFTSKIGLTILGTIFALFLIAGGVFTYYYIKYSRIIDARLSGNVLQNTTQIFSAPEHISAGQAWGPDDTCALHAAAIRRTVALKVGCSRSR